MAACTIFIMGVTSPYAVYDAISLDPVVANPGLILMFAYLNLLFSVGTGLAALQISLEMALGNCVGAGLGLGVAYAAYAIAGDSREDTPSRAVSTVCLSGALVLVQTVMRFRFRQHSMFWMQSIMGLALSVAVSYHATYALWRFPVCWMWYACMAAGTLLLVMSLVFPLYAGDAVRAALADGLTALAATVAGGLELASGPIDPETGLLAACTGKCEGREGVDAGLWCAGISKVYDDSSACGAAIATVWRWERAAGLEFDVYRRQHIFPQREFGVLTLTLRGMLSSFMMTVYPLQTGRLACRAAHAHGPVLRALGAAICACCERLAAVLRGQVRLADALGDLSALEAGFEALETCVALELGAAGPLTLSADALSFRLLVTTLRTLSTRVCQLHLCLAGAVGRDDPGARDALAVHLAVRTGRDDGIWGPGSRGERDRGPQSAATDASVMPSALVDALRAKTAGDELLCRRGSSKPVSVAVPSLSALSEAAVKQGPPGATPSSLLTYLEAQVPELRTLAADQATPAWADRIFGRLREMTGIDKHHLAVGLQGVVGYVVILVMVLVPSVDDAFDGRMLWGLLIVITILEQITGQVVLKGIQRIAGTALGCGVGVAVIYLTYACNGATYSSAHVQKYVLLPFFLAVAVGIIGACAVRFSRYFYSFLIACIIMGVVATPNYYEDVPLPITAVWRLAATAVAVGVNVVLAATLFPVTARSVYEALLAGMLEQLADVMEGAYGCLVPREHRRARRGRHRGPIRRESRGLGTKPDARRSGLGLSRMAARGSVDEAPGSVSDEVSAPAHGRRYVDTARRASKDTLTLASSNATATATATGTLESQGPGEPNAASLASQRVASIYTELPALAGRFKLVGGAYLGLEPALKSIGLSIQAMHGLDQALHYEFYPFRRRMRFPFVAARRSLRLCRQLANVAGSFSAALDAHDTYSCPPLIAVAPELGDVGVQLRACLQALAGVVRGTVRPDRAADMALNLSELTEHLLLSTLARADESLIEAGQDAVLAVTLLAMLLNAAYVVRLLCAALCVAFAPDADAGQLEQLTSETRWALDDRLIVLCSDLLATALCHQEADDPTDGGPGVREWESELAAFSRLSCAPGGTLRAAEAANAER